MKLTNILLLLPLICAATSAGSARAALLGDVIKPFASVSEVYESNVFLIKDREQLRLLTGGDRFDDFSTVVSVGSGLNYHLGRQELNLFLKRDFIRYSHDTVQDADRDEAKLKLDLSVYDKIKMSFDGAYSKAPQSRNDYLGDGLNEVTNLSGGATLGYVMISGLGFETSYRREEVGYSLARYNGNEYSVDRYAGRVMYRTSPLTMFYAGLQRDEIAYHGELHLGGATLNNDSTSDSIRLGLERSAGAKTTVSGYIGYLQRRHNSAGGRDFDGVIGRLALNHQLSAKLGLTLTGERQLYEETYADQIYSVSESIGLGAVYQVTQKIKINLSDRLIWKSFKDLPGSGVAKRSDLQQELKAGIGWTPINRLSVDIGYIYLTRSSDDSTLDYNAHTLLTSLSYHF